LAPPALPGDTLRRDFGVGGFFVGLEGAPLASAVAGTAAFPILRRETTETWAVVESHAREPQPTPSSDM
jgi:hypothetical protein